MHGKDIKSLTLPVITHHAMSQVHIRGQNTGVIVIKLFTIYKQCICFNGYFYQKTNSRSQSHDKSPDWKQSSFT